MRPDIDPKYGPYLDGNLVKPLCDNSKINKKI